MLGGINFYEAGAILLKELYVLNMRNWILIKM